MLIYLVTNLTNGKRYVGQTRLKLEQRWKMHVYYAINRGVNTLFARALRKYGADAFSVSVLCTCSSQEELDAREREYISSLGTQSSTGKGFEPLRPEGRRFSGYACARKRTTLAPEGSHRAHSYSKKEPCSYDYCIKHEERSQEPFRLRETRLISPP